MIQSKYQKSCDVTSELLKRRNSFTPDFLELKLKDRIPVFTYGTLRVGQKRFSTLEDQVYLGEAYSATQNYEMVNSEMDFPVALNSEFQSVKGASIFGEVFLVKPEIILELDLIESNGEMYKREERWFYLLDQQTKKRNIRPSMKCWVYMGVRDFWKSYTTFPITPKMVTPNKPRRVYEWTPSFSLLNDHIPF